MRSAVRHLTRSQLLGPALAIVRRAGLDPTAVLSQAGLSPSVAKESADRVPLRAFRALLAECAHVTEDPFFGLTLAADLPRGKYGIVEYLASTAPTVGDMLRVAARYTSLDTETAVSTLAETETALLFDHRVPGEPLGLGAEGNECFVALTLRSLRWRAGASFAVERAWIAHRRENVAELAAALDLPVLEDGAGTNGIQISRAVADLPLAGSDPALHAILRDHAELLLAARAGSNQNVGSVRAAVREHLREGVPSLEEVARTLRTTARTLQRRLSEEGATFQEVVESEREALAREMLTDRRMSVGEVAFALHYSDSSGFVRAFRRWTGTTPGEYRSHAS